MLDGQFEFDNALTLSRDFIELTQVTCFIKYLYLIKMFIFINSKKVHLFLLQPKKSAFTQFGEYKLLNFTNTQLPKEHILLQIIVFIAIPNISIKMDFFWKVLLSLTLESMSELTFS